MNKKNRKILLIIIVAFMVAVMGGVATFMYLNPQKTTVYVFKDNYNAGDVITEEMLTPVRCDASIIVAGSNAETASRFVTGQDIDAVLKTGDSLRMDVASGMPLTISLLSVNGGSSVEMSMDPTKVAVTVPLTSITGVTPELKDGSKVNIYATGGESNGTVLLFQGMRVLSVQNDSDGNLSSATIECDSAQSLKLIYAVQNSSIYFGLIDSAGYEYADGEPSYIPGS